MTNLTIVLAIIVFVLLNLYVKSINKRKALKKDIAHQRALVSCLRWRLGDNQDNSQPFTILELKEINEWSDKEIIKLN